MSEAQFNQPCPVSAEQKQAALDVVLRSQTFARADQLKSFLKYVCDMEQAGRGSELSEYLIGTEALGRPSNYSPGDDSGVRTRAFALRKKLQDFYDEEEPSYPIRIELAKGSYCPRYVEYKSTSEPFSIQAEDQVAEVKVPSPPNIVQQSGRRRFPAWLLPFACGVFATSVIALGFYFYTRRHNAGTNVSSEPPSIIMEAWGPILNPSADVLLCIANPPGFTVHPGSYSPATPSVPFTFPGAHPMPKDLRELFLKQYTTAQDLNLTMTMTRNSSYWGDTLGAFTALKTMNSAGCAPRIFPELSITLSMLRRSNVVILGAPDYSAAVARYQQNCPWRVNYLDAIVGAHDASEPRYAMKLGQQQRITEVFGLITVLPGEEAAAPHKVLVFSGVNSAGAQAASEFFSSAEHLVELKKEFKKAGYDTFPPAYQVVVRARTEDSILLNYSYEALKAFQPPRVY